MEKMKTTTYILEVETKEVGQRRPYSDSYYHYIVKNKSDINYHDSVIKKFCMDFLRKSYNLSDMPNPFAGRLVKFEKIADRTWEYKSQEMYTG